MLSESKKIFAEFKEGAMPDASVWEKRLQRSVSHGFRVVALDGTVTEQGIRELIGEHLPPGVVEFCRKWQDDHSEPWQVWVMSILSQAPAAREVHQIASDYPLRRLVERARRAAIIWGNRAALISPDPWAFLLELQPRNTGTDPAYLRLHLPASPASITAAEAVLGIPLPTSFTRLLALTNGVGVDADEYVGIAGAGPQRAIWEPVVANDWLHCAHYNEVTARWREFQGVYAYERERDQEEGANTFLSDERILVPFMVTFWADVWCFDRSRYQADGEYPIMFWDHELCQASEKYPNFMQWMEQRLETEVYGK